MLYLSLSLFSSFTILGFELRALYLLGRQVLYPLIHAPSPTWVSSLSSPVVLAPRLSYVIQQQSMKQLCQCLLSSRYLASFPRYCNPVAMSKKEKLSDKSDIFLLKLYCVPVLSTSFHRFLLSCKKTESHPFKVYKLVNFKRMMSTPWKIPTYLRHRTLLSLSRAPPPSPLSFAVIPALHSHSGGTGLLSAMTGYCCL
jgi:hypothetical protein